MLFSPTTERSPRVRLLYATLYGLLGLGALTMIVPFLIMISGSVEPQSSRDEISLFPRYLIDDSALWQRYLEAKYWAQPDNLRQAWEDSQATFSSTKWSPPQTADREAAKLWGRFLHEHGLRPQLLALGFLRQDKRMPSYSERQFRHWMLRRYRSLENLNATLHEQIPNVLDITAPVTGFLGFSAPDTLYVGSFYDFASSHAPSRSFAWNVAGYYRSIFLPRTVGPDVADYNRKYGTHHASYADVPFPATAPVVGIDSWFFYVSRLLRPDFVELTPSGETERAAYGLEKEEFIRTRARQEHLRVVSADVLFAEWCRHVHVAEPTALQQSLDHIAFEKEKKFWRWRFLQLNYLHVLDQIALHGRAITNTMILVALMIGGALIINPLAAYALSRFKLRLSYHVLLFCLATIAFPAEVTMIPVFLQLKEFHLLNTFAALVLPTVANGFSIFLLKGFFDSLPREIYEAAEIDGASEWTIFWQVTMNLSRPILAVLALEAFVTAYGAFFYALIIAPDPQMWTIMVYIYQLRQSVDAPVVYASLILSAIPTLLVFVFCQNIILRGIVVPSEK